MENLATFLKNEEKIYKQRIPKKSKTGLKMDYHSFSLAIKENVKRIEDAYKDYMNEDIKKDAFEHRITQNELDIIHWQNMIEIVVEELLKRI